MSSSLDRRRAARIARFKLADDELLSADDIPEKYHPFMRPPEPQIDQILSELDGLVGLEPVKTYLRQMTRRLQLEASRMRSDPGISGEVALQNLVFIGNPGTGKTTVARIIGRIYQALGLLKKGHCIEVSRADLVAGYVGQTALKTREKIKASLDGVLFIDEAYTLESISPGDYGREAVDTLVKAMEDFRSRMVVVAAGYPREMAQFLASNPGLKSRFGTILEFPDFQRDELQAILTQQALRDHISLTDLVMNQALDYLFMQAQYDGAHFGNARTVQNLYEKMKNRMAERVMELTETPTSSDPQTSVNQFEQADVPDRLISMISV